MEGQERLIYLWNGSEWVKVIGESVANPNLRVRLYGGANFIAVTQSAAAHARTNYGLTTYSALYADDGTNLSRLDMLLAQQDALANTFNGLGVTSMLYGFNGATFDRLRTDGLGVLKVSKGDIQPTRVRKTSTGRVGVAGAKKLFWIACSPDGPSAEWEISDSDVGGAAIEYDHFDTDKHSDHIDFNPPMEFATGIWVEKFDHMKSLVFCYE